MVTAHHFILGLVGKEPFQGEDQVPGASTAALHCGAVLLVDWAEHHRGLVPDLPPAVVGQGGERAGWVSVHMFRSPPACTHLSLLVCT